MNYRHKTKGEPLYGWSNEPEIKFPETRIFNQECMGKVRYIADGRIFFMEVTVVLTDGKVLTAIDDTTVSDIDANRNVYLFRQGVSGVEI